MRSDSISVPSISNSGLFRSLFNLTKPNLVAMILVTTTAGFFLSPMPMDYWRLIQTLIGTALSAGGTLALNQYIERQSDALMMRTAKRPIPTGCVSPRQALIFGLVISTIGAVYLSVVINPLTTGVIIAIHFSYLLIYTPLKQKSPISTFLGAIPGALPPVAGWCAASGRIDLGAGVLFAILFWWQLPHSLSIAWLYRDDYAQAGFQLLPIVQPNGKSTIFHIWFQTLILLFVGLLPAVPIVQIASYRYLFVATLTGLVFLGLSLSLAWSPSQLAAKRVLSASLVYLPLILVAMIADQIF